jgi:hypothetical protein
MLAETYTSRHTCGKTGARYQGTALWSTYEMMWQGYERGNCSKPWPLPARRPEPRLLSEIEADRGTAWRTDSIIMLRACQAAGVDPMVVYDPGYIGRAPSERWVTEWVVPVEVIDIIVQQCIEAPVEIWGYASGAVDAVDWGALTRTNGRHYACPPGHCKI